VTEVLPPDINPHPFERKGCALLYSASSLSSPPFSSPSAPSWRSGELLSPKKKGTVATLFRGRTSTKKFRCRDPNPGLSRVRAEYPNQLDYNGNDTEFLNSLYICSTPTCTKKGARGGLIMCQVLGVSHFPQKRLLKKYSGIYSAWHHHISNDTRTLKRK
jgi:hypothetical protein